MNQDIFMKYTKKVNTVLATIMGLGVISTSVFVAIGILHYLSALSLQIQCEPKDSWAHIAFQENTDSKQN